jgi:hypothetical protein
MVEYRELSEEACNAVWGLLPGNDVLYSKPYLAGVAEPGSNPRMPSPGQGVHAFTILEEFFWSILWFTTLFTDSTK